MSTFPQPDAQLSDNHQILLDWGKVGVQEDSNLHQLQLTSRLPQILQIFTKAYNHVNSLLEPLLGLVEGRRRHLKFRRLPSESTPGDQGWGRKGSVTIYLCVFVCVCEREREIERSHCKCGNRLRFDKGTCVYTYISVYICLYVWNVPLRGKDRNRENGECACILKSPGKQPVVNCWG